ncbi:MAG: glutathione S-transferase N-terminal domain-containing protein [Alphaproteobacteria bacterium]|nr:glutathione S-transferase N-terminal domain-containing protein [Alphaproteobacteria bacterium]
MTLKMYDLAAADPAIRFSPNCWRVRMALAHKGLDVETIAWRFTDKEVISFSQQGKTPVLVDGDRWIADSWSIAEYLDEARPDTPKLFECAQSKAHAWFVKNWIETAVNPGVAKQIIVPLFAMLDEKDKSYFRETREKAFGMTLEAFGADAADALATLRKTLQPLRVTLSTQPFLGGQAPSFADYVAFGAFQWARTSAPHDILEEGDVVAAWRATLLEMYDGLAGNMPARVA